MSKLENAIERLNTLAPLDIVTDDYVRSRFIEVYNTLWGRGGETAYEKESRHFVGILRDKPDLQKAVKFSIFNCFIDIAVCGLSIEPGARALAYLQGRNCLVGKTPDGKGIYEGRLTLAVSGYGELVLRTRAGQIRHADNPVLVYEEDDFKFSDNDGQKSVRFTCNYPHTSNHIIACYICITRCDGTRDYSVMFEEDWLRLKKYSEENNKRWDNNTKQYVHNANALYSSNEGSIDPGFLKAKLIKHAFSTYPKVRIGRVVLESDQPDVQAVDENGFIADPSRDNDAHDSGDSAQQTFQDPNQNAAGGVTVDPASAGGNDDDDTF